MGCEEEDEEAIEQVGKQPPNTKTTKQTKEYFLRGNIPQHCRTILIWCYFQCVIDCPTSEFFSSDPIIILVVYERNCPKIVLSLSFPALERRCLVGPIYLP